MLVSLRSKTSLKRIEDAEMSAIAADTADVRRVVGIATLADIPAASPW
jgi:hypothetical protein